MSGSLLASSKVPLNELPALLFPALLDTLIMVGIVMSIVVAVGIPVGALIHNLAPGGLLENPSLHTTLSWVISIGRSLPFLILMAAIMPVTRLITGTNIGIAAAVVPMSLAGIAFFTRIVENSLRSVPPAVVQVARASGGSRLQVIRSAQLGEAVPSIIGGLTINIIAMIEYSAIAGTIGAGGIGYVAVTYGYQRFDQGVMLATIVILVITVAVVQLTGDGLVRSPTPHPRAPGFVFFFGTPPRTIAPGRRCTDRPHNGGHYGVALSATVFKVELGVSDVDHGYYADHTLTVARHPSENDERMVVRLLAFGLRAHRLADIDGELAFGPGLSTPGVPDLRLADYTGRIVEWINVGQPDERVLGKAAGQADEVMLFPFAAGVATWWRTVGAKVAGLSNLSVVQIPHAPVQQLAQTVERRVAAQVMVMEGEVTMTVGGVDATFTPVPLQ